MLNYKFKIGLELHIKVSKEFWVIFLMLNSSSSKQFKMPNKQKAIKPRKQNRNSICQKSNQEIKLSKKETDKGMNWLLNNRRYRIKRKHQSFLEEPIVQAKIFK